MKTGLFKLFVKMIGDIPDAEILKAVEIEQGMLESHLMYKSILETPEVDSILCFCQFIGAAMDEDGFFPVELPSKHIAFYQTVVMRLVESGEMPSHVIERFDFTFKRAGLKVQVQNKNNDLPARRQIGFRPSSATSVFLKFNDQPG